MRRASDHAPVFCQPSDRGDGHRHHHGHCRSCFHGAPPHRAIPEHCSPADSGQCDLCRRRCPHRRAIRGHADRTASQWRRGHGIHVFGQCQQRQHDAQCLLRRRHRADRRPDPDPDAAEPGQFAVARSGRRIRHDRAAKHLRPAAPFFALFAGQGLRRPLSRQLRLYQPEQRVGPPAGNLQRGDLRRRSIRHAHLAHPGPTGQARRHRAGNHQCGQAAEPRQSDRKSRRQTRPRWTGIRLHSHW